MAYVIVNGEVNRTFFDGKGASIVEKFTKRDGTEGSSYYSAFFTEPHGLEVGDAGVFKGNLSVSLRNYEVDGEVRYSADATINNTKAEEIVSGAGAVPATAGATKGF